MRVPSGYKQGIIICKYIAEFLAEHANLVVLKEISFGGHTCRLLNNV